jgi:ABC-type multidrug transport system fused ATPase/permease subunit
VIVSHDLNLIRCADRICVVDSGRIVELGTHDDLLRAGGLYADLYARQFATHRSPVHPPAEAGSWRAGR